MMEGSEFSSVTVWKTAAANAEFIAGGFKITRFKHMSQPGLPWPVFPVESTQSASSTGLLELLVPCAGHVGFFCELPDASTKHPLISFIDLKGLALKIM
jgi:hypothetical protein